VLTLATIPALVAPGWSAVSPARKCAAAKAKATAAKASAKVACYRTAITKNVDVDPDCLAKAEAKFAKAFATLEAKGGCATSNDAGDLEATVDAFVDDVVTALVPNGGFPTPTPSAAGTPGPTATPAPTPTCASPLTHSDGLGDTYLDCSPLGTPGDATTYTVLMATEARDAWPMGPSQNRAQLCGAPASAAACVVKRTTTDCAVWCYSGAVAGYVRAVTGGKGVCQCPTTTDPAWN